ncbi:carboxymuconolactone decarboxylase family protein [Melioribacteraceae bacterium 4301-Me]|uniref:carboxymuconolactone decarboxylase family protein n=1 Tax=Pyranulibacter aquaticus TaxID=3163344 RepID=UPI003597409D
MGNTQSHFDPKTSELIAIGASIGGNCLPCLRYHFAEALKLGCTIHEIEEAIRIAKMIKERPINDIYNLAEDLISREKERR